jgi:hypothetical protein
MCCHQVINVSKNTQKNFSFPHIKFKIINVKAICITDSFLKGLGPHASEITFIHGSLHVVTVTCDTLCDFQSGVQF